MAWTRTEFAPVVPSRVFSVKHDLSMQIERCFSLLLVSGCSTFSRTICVRQPACFWAGAVSLTNFRAWTLHRYGVWSKDIHTHSQQFGGRELAKPALAACSIVSECACAVSSLLPFNITSAWSLFFVSPLLLLSLAITYSRHIACCVEGVASCRDCCEKYNWIPLRAKLCATKKDTLLHRAILQRNLQRNTSCWKNCTV